eukprot:gene37154-45096_t
MSIELGPSDPTLKRAFWAVLDRIDALEEALDDKIESVLRDYTSKSEPVVRPQTLRLFFRYQFVPATNLVKGHFLIIIDGFLLNSSCMDAKPAPFMQHLQQIKISVNERKANAEPQVVEWAEGVFPEGSSASTVVCRVYGEKACTVRISLQGVDDFWYMRYDTPEVLRRLFPGCAVSMSLDEMLLMVLQHAESTRLFGDRDRRYIRCDEKLKELFGIDTLPIWNVRQKLIGMLTAPSASTLVPGQSVPSAAGPLTPTAVAFDFQLTPAQSEEAQALQSQFNQRVLAQLLARSRDASEKDKEKEQKTDGPEAGEVAERRDDPSSVAPRYPPLVSAEGLPLGARALQQLFLRMGGKVVDVQVQERAGGEPQEAGRMLALLHAAAAQHHEALRRKKQLSVSAELALREGMQDLHTAEMLGELLRAVHGDRAAADHANCGGVYVERERAGRLHLQSPAALDLLALRHAQQDRDRDRAPLRSMASILHPYGGYVNVHSDRHFSGLRGGWDEAAVAEAQRMGEQIYGQLEKRRRVDEERDRGVVADDDSGRRGLAEAESKT